MAKKRVQAIVALLLLLPLVSGDCDIDATLSASTYNGGNTVEYTIEPSPSHGFVKVEIKNPLDQKIYSVEREITGDFTFKMATNTTWLNGTYGVDATYLRYYNGTTLVDCGVKTNHKFELRTPFAATGSSMWVNITADYKLVNVTKTGRVENNGVSYEVELTGQGVEGKIPDFSINGVSVIDAAGMGNLEMSITRCEADESWVSTMNDMSAWYQSSKTQCDEDKDVRAKCTQAYSDLGVLHNDTQRDYIKMKGIAESKMDGGQGFLLFLGGVIACYLFLFVVHRKVSGEFNIPSEISSAMRRARKKEKLKSIDSYDDDVT